MKKVARFPRKRGRAAFFLGQQALYLVNLELQGFKVRNPNWTRDELILALNLYISAGRKWLDRKHPDVIALSQLLNELPIHSTEDREVEFRNPNGVSMKLGTFLSLDPEYPGKGLRRGSKLEQEVWDNYADKPYELHQVARAITSSLALGIAESPVSYELEGDDEFCEGRILTLLHMERERNPKVVRRKKEKVLKELGRLACEVCGFDFAEVYGERGVGFSECHHLVPLAQLTMDQSTRLSDLAIVCANCHRMLHRGPSLLSIEELQMQLRYQRPH